LTTKHWVSATKREEFWSKNCGENVWTLISNV